MSKLNPATTPITVQKAAAKANLSVGTSANGNEQFAKESHQMLYEIVVSTLFGKGTFYKSGDKLVSELKQHLGAVVQAGSFDFVANLAIHARGEMNIRTIPIVLVVEFAKALHDNGSSYEHMRHLVCDVIQRADQVTDMYAYALDVFGGKNKIPMAIKRGVADAFNKFTEYQFGKYNRAGAVKFRDVLRIVHPTATTEVQGAIFAKIMNDSLAVPYTWETELSINGQLPAAEQKTKAQLWTELVTSGKLGYMALLRNLRNIHQAEVSPSVIQDVVCSRISDPSEVAKSKQLPFDFVEAYTVVKEANGKMATAVSRAIDISCGNLPPLGKRIWLVVDFSGSMGYDPIETDGARGYYSGYGNSTSAISTATLLAAALLKSSGDNADSLAVTLFGSAAKLLTTIDTNQSVMGIKEQLLKHRVGSIAGSTNFEAALNQYSQLKFVPDTIIVLTDGEVNRFPYQKLWAISKKPNVVKVAINLAAASTTPMIQQDGWYSIAGWSTAMFKWIPAIRNKSSAVTQLSGPYTRGK